ncbi:FecCD family ABC transporter permease [Corynebacterium pseudotuberculosis]|uniref:FecCD family ABC transporter permease n=1 Tax=Corynebacterium pseudotuberculosis TaxID=1719 RepID=UPI00056F0AAC|nr:iron ABC transporter permease [Corynebacterium pseudotuberculosis]
MFISQGHQLTVQYTGQRTTITTLVLSIMVLFIPALSVCIGAAGVAPSHVFGVILSHIPHVPVDISWDRATDAIIWHNRFPRVLLGLAVGAILGVSGVVFQAVIRNSLAEPYVLGVSSGASTGAAFSLIILGLSSAWAMGFFAFAGSVIATCAVLIIAGRSSSPLKLILSGLAIGFGAQAFTNFIIFTNGSPETNQAVMFWMLGSLGRARWQAVVATIIVAVFLTLLMAIIGPLLDALASGDETARAVGVPPEITRLLVLIVVSAAVAIAVSSSGGIGFVGLIVPHIMRIVSGYSHRMLVINTALASALFLVLADALARVLISPQELPIGVLTGLIGAPVLAILIRRTTNV